MEKYKNAFVRISELMTLLMSDISDEAGKFSLDRISDLTGIPRNVLRNDLLYLCENKKIYNELSVAWDKETDGNNDERKGAWLNSLRREEKKAFAANLSISASSFTDMEEGEAFFVNLTPFEKNVFSKIADISYVSEAVWIKDPVFAAGTKDPDCLGSIQIAIEQNHPISFKYVSSEGEEICNGFCARYIYEVLENGVKYCVGVTEDGSLSLRRLDRISELYVHEDEQMPPLPDGAIDKLDYMWGADASTDEKVHVKIKIYKETKNIFEKIKTETNGRKYRKLYDDPKEEGIAYYEDEVCGLNSFKKWLRTYGASVVALEPLSLAEDMYQSAKRRLDRYRPH